jgi:hypothetical protein
MFYCNFTELYLLYSFDIQTHYGVLIIYAIMQLCIYIYIYIYIYLWIVMLTLNNLLNFLLLYFINSFNLT